MLQIGPSTCIDEQEIQFNAIRSSGPGGQHVNKTSTAIHLRFDIHASSLPERIKTRLMAINDSRISPDGVINIKAQSHRSREKNRKEALQRLAELLRRAGAMRKPRIPTRPARRAIESRLQSKKRRGRLKKLRGTRPGPDE